MLHTVRIIECGELQISLVKRMAFLSLVQSEPLKDDDLIFKLNLFHLSSIKSSTFVIAGLHYCSTF
jgi:hypothetical protein